MDVLVPCPACRRHVRTREARCPFCAAALPSSLRAHRYVDPPRASRAAMFAFAAALAGCKEEASATKAPEKPATSASQGTSPMVDDTGPAIDATAPDAAEDVDTFDAVFDVAVVDAKKVSVPVHPALPKYGAPPPPHAITLYGAPPTPKKPKP